MANEPKHGLSRRQFLENVTAVTAGIATARLTGRMLTGTARAAEAPTKAAPRGGLRWGNNILFVFTDQER
jgi:hypothetical protein